ncbi:hypothetical protein [Lentibacter sp. XHP0401]|uniref:hypothetical protein n=1 Tax=Lentibacter sp. XHP0401 TaxID=2984334 RepID=UPI0021E6F725|nr:hypothetical protein [Lentibacter sp. XHP0401]MCV2892201.1 hypothetical protein [Lentibacter sp. XHP0401]
MSSEPGKTEQNVHRRRVFYIPGYDPIHPRRYRELYRKESATQAEISGYEINLSPKTTKGPYGWHVNAVINEQAVQTDVEALVWSDIVRDSMRHTISSTFSAMLRTAWVYIGTGALWRLMRLRKGPVIAALYPVLMLIVQALLAVLVAWVVMRGVVALVAWLVPNLASVAPYIGLALGLGGGWALLIWFKKQDAKFFVYYLMHDYSYSALHKGANSPELEARMAEFSDAIAEALTQEYDEVLLVGHSSGAHLGVSILSDLIRAGRVPDNGPKLGFLSLGQVVPMVSFLPDAWRLRSDLAYLCARDELFWLDVTAPGDGCAFALCDPVAVSGVAPEGQRWPLVISAAFTQTLSAERWKELRWRFFRLHFQYLCAFDRPRDYDYFQITAGPLTLSERFSRRGASRSRIDKAVNKYTSVRP